MPRHILRVKEIVGPSDERLNLDWQQMFSRDNFIYYHQYVLRDCPFLYYGPKSVSRFLIFDEMSKDEKTDIKKINIFK